MKFRWLAIAIISLLPEMASAQWLDHKTAGIPRRPDGKLDLSAPAPKKPNGQPDLSGIWLVPGL